jgi:hypothetical protein
MTSNMPSSSLVIESETRIHSDKKRMLKEAKEKLDEDLRYMAKSFEKCKQKNMIKKEPYNFYDVLTKS